MSKAKTFFINTKIKIKNFNEKVKNKSNVLNEKAKNNEAKIDGAFIKAASPFKKWFDKYKYLLFALIILALSLGMKYALVPYCSNDFYYFIEPWIYQMHLSGGGIKGLINLYNSPLDHMMIPELNAYFNVRTCDYPPLYMYLLSLISYAPVGEAIQTFGRGDTLVSINYIYLVKTISFIFDSLMALFAYKIVNKLSKNKIASLVAFSLILFLPTLNINSAVWGQCDILYAFMVVASIYYIMENKQIKSMLLFGLSLSFKLQGIFILPLFGFLWFRKSFRLRYMLIVPCLVFVTFLPLWMGGASFQTPFLPYQYQLNEYKALNLNSTSIFAILNFFDSSSLVGSKALSIAGIILMVMVSFVTISLLAFKKVKVDSNSILTVSTFFVITVPFLLPHMHERYFFLADIMFVIYAVTKIKRLHLPIMMQISSIFAISCYGIIHISNETLSKASLLLIGAILNIISIAFLIYDLIKLPREDENIESFKPADKEEISLN